MELPTVDEINPFSKCLDAQCAVEHFYGKTLEQAEALFRENGVYYSEDLLWMGPVGFRFYFKAALAYLKSDFSIEDSDFVSSIIGVVNFRIIGVFSDFQAIKGGDDYIEFCQYLLDHYSKFNLDENIYGDLRPRIRRLLEQLKS